MENKSFREVDENNWDDFAQFFEGKGCASYCWCMAWRPLPGDRQNASNATRKKAMHALVKQGTPIGILAYDGKQPVAWCSIAPRPSYRPLGGEDYSGIAEEKTWSIVCFYIPRALRGQGIIKALLTEAIRVARQRGARSLPRRPRFTQLPPYGLRLCLQRSWLHRNRDGGKPQACDAPEAYLVIRFLSAKW